MKKQVNEENIALDTTPKISGEEKRPRSRLTEIHSLEWKVLSFANQSRGFQMSDEYIDELSRCEMEQLKKMSLLVERYSEEVMEAMHTVEAMLGDMWALPHLQEDFIRTYAALGSEHRTLIANGPKIMVTNINALDHHMGHLRRILKTEQEARDAHNRLHKKKPRLTVVQNGNTVTFERKEDPSEEEEEEEKEEEEKEEEEEEVEKEEYKPRFPIIKNGGTVVFTMNKKQKTSKAPTQR